MDLLRLKNKAAVDITRDELLFAVDELKKQNKTLELIDVVQENGVLLANVKVFLKNSGKIYEKLRLGQLIMVIDEETSIADLTKLSDARNNARAKEIEQKAVTAEKRKQTREKNKPENNITKNGQEVSFDEMIAFLKNNVIETRQRGVREGYDSKFMSSICTKLENTKSNLTSKQHNYLCKVADKYGFSMSEKKVRAKKKSSKSSYAGASHCEHEDLGSLGYTHGSTVTCPHCGNLAEVW